MKLHDYFSYSSSEKKGFIFLVILLLITISLYWVLPFFNNHNTSDFSKFEKEIDAFLESEKKDSVMLESINTEGEKANSLTYFDPNEVSEDFWIGLGFSQKQAASIIKFRDKYGFKAKKDVRKLYVMDDQKFQMLESYLLFPEKEVVESEKEVSQPKSIINKTNAPESFSLKKKLNQSIIHLNEADTVSLKSLRGIGSSFARRIIKYRDLLGGFYSVDQLEEVYGLSQEVIEENRNRLEVDMNLVKKINVNTCSFDVLKAHPYINWNLANSIVQFRKNHGEYKSLEEIKKSDLVNDEIYRTIAPYLKID